MNTYTELLEYIDNNQPSLSKSIKESVRIKFLSNIENNPESMPEDQVHNLIEHTRKLELVNSEIRQRLNFDKGQFRKTYLVTKLTHDTVKRTVFSKGVENKYFEKVVTYNQDIATFSYEGHSSISDNYLRKINSISETISVDWKSARMLDWSQSVHRVFSLSHIPTITNVELDLAQQLIVELFTGHYDIFKTLLDCVSNLDDLSSTLFCGVILKLSCKLVPLASTKLLIYLDSDAKIKSFFLSKQNEILWRLKFPLSYNYASNVKSFLFQNRKALLSTSFISLASFHYLARRPILPLTETQLDPSIVAFANVMDGIRLNSSVVVFKLSQTLGSLVESAYSGFRYTLGESAINFLHDTISRLYNAPGGSRDRFPRFR